jgi:hypothetical protein
MTLVNLVGGTGDVGLWAFRQTFRCAASAVSVARHLLFGSAAVYTN